MITLTLTQDEFQALRFAADYGQDALPSSSRGAVKADLDAASFDFDGVHINLDGETFSDLRLAFGKSMVVFEPFDDDDRKTKSDMKLAEAKIEMLAHEIESQATPMGPG